MSPNSIAFRVLGSWRSRTRIVLLQHGSFAPGSTSSRHRLVSVQKRGFRTSAPLGFKRIWDSSCPRVWDSWNDDGVKWIIQDLRPEDDEDALNILIENVCRDERLCGASNIMNDPISLLGIREFWRGFLNHRLSLGCYEVKDKRNKLVALNVLIVTYEGKKLDLQVKGKASQNVFGVLKVCDDKVDAFKLLGVDRLIYGLGLVVHKDYRGDKLGSRILAAREPHALHHGIKGTSTVFTGPASQISAERVGFSTALTLSLKDLAEAGLDYPKDDNTHIKLMVMKYDRKEH